MNNLQIAGSINLGIGMILSVIAFILYRKKSIWLKSARTVKGIVTGMTKSGTDTFVSGSADDNLSFREEENIFKGGSYAPLIEFSDSSGQKHRIQGISSSPPRYKTGQEIELLYPENSPEKAIIDGFIEKWLVTLMLSGFGLFLSLCGLLILIFL